MQIRVTPLDRFRVLVSLADVSHELSAEVWNGSEDAPGDDITFDLVEP